MTELWERFRAFPGDVSAYYRPLDGSEPTLVNAETPLVAASVIKLPVMIEVFRRFAEGTLAPDAPVTVRAGDKLPSCGALSYLHDGLTVTVLDLTTLMIILSDNTATNLLIDLVGMDGVNRTLSALGATSTRLNRKLFDPEGIRRGINNFITAREIGLLLEGLYHGRIVSAAASRQMLEILKNQRLNGKIPFFLEPLGVPVAHKTGEDEGITHDAAIVFAQRPFVFVALGNRVDAPAYERLMQDAARTLYQQNITKILQK